MSCELKHFLGVPKHSREREVSLLEVMCVHRMFVLIFTGNDE
jgi:hypothetical protein